MTKADFLQLLERALAQLPEEERRANLEYYSELLDDMLEEGMTEAEATAKLGSPSQIAQSILQEVPLGKLVSTRMKPKSGWTPLAIVLAVVGSPVWVPLLLLAAALVLSLFVSIWALGVAAVLVLVGALVGPLLRTLAVVFMLRLSAALLEPIADGDIVCAIGDFSRTVVLFFITMLCVGTMYFLLIVQVLLVGNLTVLLR